MKTHRSFTLVVYLGLGALLYAADKPADPRVDPAMTSIHPFTGQRGSTFVVKVRGRGLAGARAALPANAALQMTTEGVGQEPPEEGSRSKTPVDVVTLRVEAPADLKAGRYAFRLVGKNGVSNSLPLLITEEAVAAEPEGLHQTPETAVVIGSRGTVFNGKLTRRGEADFYKFEAKAGETVTFQLHSGLPQTAAGGSAATIANFDPALTIFEGGTSWFDSARLRRIAYNDEPEFVFGKPTDSHLVHTFAKAGSYLLRVDAFAGQGGADYSYALKVLPGAVPYVSAPGSGGKRGGGGEGWSERSFTRQISPSRLNELALRGGVKPDRPVVENYRALPVAVEQAPRFALPGNLEGEIANPGETHRAHFEVDGPRDIALEMETPQQAPPYFNPIVRLLNADGDEVATNLFAGRGACSGALSKSIQAKTIVPLREAGKYTVEIRDATSDLGGPGFRYRLQVRPQVPHVGDVNIASDHLNLAPAEASTVRVMFDREEDYRGAIAVTAEGLPAGVTVAAGADFEPDKDEPLTKGKRERYTPRTERSVLVFSAAPDAPATVAPQQVRVVVRPVANGKLGDVIAAKTIPMMVLAKP
ncbi:MAG: DVUA0089 family protein [Bryobacterales bacterium]|nr:DVUA0089 family protein [Bryobacterales bacterium]